MNDDSEKQQIIEAIKERTGELLQSRWEAIQALRVDPEKGFKISFGHRLTFRGDHQTIKSTISFGLRESESVETTIEDGSQMRLFGGDAGPNGDTDPNDDGSSNRAGYQYPAQEEAEPEEEESLSIAAAAASEPDPAPPPIAKPKRSRGRPSKAR